MQRTREETSFIDDARDVAPIARAQRINLGLTQEALASRAGVGRRFVVDLEAGKKTVQADQMFKVLNALEFDILARRDVPEYIPTRKPRKL